MGQKKIKLINRYLKFKKLDKLVIADGDRLRNVAKEVKRFYNTLSSDHKASFSNSLKENYETAKRTNS